MWRATIFSHNQLIFKKGGAGLAVETVDLRARQMKYLRLFKLVQACEWPKPFVH